MTKKEYIIKVLEKVTGYWDKAIIIKEYIATHDDEQYINYLYENFVIAVEKTTKEQNNNKIKLLSNYIADLHEKEVLSKQADEEDIVKLDNLLSTL
jgi:hypothetical protein